MKNIHMTQRNKMWTSAHLRHLVIVFLVILALQSVLCADTKQDSCSRHTCQPPSCRCPAHSIPGNLRPETVPQMILIAFDDAVNWDNWEFYLRLFPTNGSRKNPNGCPISATFFVSHNFTDYCMVRKLHARGMEIGDHSVTHKLPRQWWTDADKQMMADEVLAQRTNLAEKAHIPEHHIRGWRSPFLQPAGDDLFSLLHENNFTYDATMTYSFPKNLYSPVLWPFTLDYGFTLVCNIERCPQGRYPGLWIVPVVVLMDHREQKPCAYVDDCANMPRDKDEAYQMLWKNFLRNYRSNRAPLYLNLHSPWLTKEYQLQAMDEFITKMGEMDDVYLVTIHQALQWQMDPTPLDKIHEFQPWQCPDFEPNAEDRKICKFVYKHKKGSNTGVYSQHMSHNTGHENAVPTPEITTVSQDHHVEVNGGETEQPVSQPPKAEDAHDEHDHEWHEHHDGTASSSKTGEAVDVHDEADRNSVHHHHNHRTHKPWFLRGGAASACPHLMLVASYAIVVTLVKFL